MSDMQAVRWGVLGTANIAAGTFLPAMRAAGGTATLVASRNPQRAAGWAREHQVGRAVSYDEALDAPDVDAYYVALPNDAHVQWAARAAATGRAVLCEKPLGLDLAQVRTLLDRAPDAALWEAFVFPFHPQTQLLRSLCAPDGPLAGVREIVSEFHFTLAGDADIRWQIPRGGGALLDVGCYPIRLARLLFEAEPQGAAARTTPAPGGVDAEVAAVLDFAGDRRLILSVGMLRASSTFTRVIGTDAELRVDNPFHPGDGDGVHLWREGALVQSWPADPKPAFQWGVEHIQQVVRGQCSPRHLAAEDAPGNAAALDLVRAAARS